MDELYSFFQNLDDEWKVFLKHSMRITLIVLAAIVVQFVASTFIRRVRKFIAARKDDADQARRVETLGRVLRYIAMVVITLIAGMLVLDELGISVAPVLATAGVAGLAVGFGAQSLIKDYFNGVFLLLEDQVRQGDIVNIGGEGGLVEEVTLRYVRLRNFDGHVFYVPNGEIKLVKNLTRDFAQAVIRVGIAYREDVEEALAVMREVGKAMRADPVFGERIADDVEIVGVDAWGDSSVDLICRLKVVPPIQQFSVRREYLKRLKKAYDERGIEIPFPHLTVYAGEGKDGSAPPLRVMNVGREAA